ncbi:MAG: Smr/MutS family protein [Bacilli bacterium]|nr:Smr/MutS family protein [Bacilli bacterium]
MMHIDEVIYIDNLPKIDLHGENSETARVLINDFINDNYKQQNNLFCIVHGIGSGLLRTTTSDTLRKNKKVIAYKTYYYNQGCTLVEINLDK